MKLITVCAVGLMAASGILAQSPAGTVVKTAENTTPIVSGDKPQPRVYMESASKGSNRNSDRDQSMEMSKDFLKVCPNVKITINQQTADYTVRLNHIEHGLLFRDNQIQVFDKNGDLMKNKEGGSIKGDVKQICHLINTDFSSK
jgi:hypothetical protein